MADLITESEMALWCQSTVEALAADPFAAEVRSKVSAYVCFLAQQPLWTVDTVPIDVKMLTIRVIRRTYVNPDSEVQTGIGPISSRILDEAALAAAFTDSEIKLLETKIPDGSGQDGLWVASIGGADVLLQPTVYLSDDSQVGLLDSADPRSWDIPMFDINDNGGPE